MGSINLKSAIFLGILIVIGTCPRFAMAGGDCSLIVKVDASDYCAVSIYAIIANPSRHHGKTVRVVGYLKFEMNSAVLGPSLDAVSGAIIEPDVILLEVDEKQSIDLADLDGKLVAVYARFSHDLSRGLLIDKQLVDVRQIHEH